MHSVSTLFFGSFFASVLASLSCKQHVWKTTLNSRCARKSLKIASKINIASFNRDFLRIQKNRDWRKRSWFFHDFSGFSWAGHREDRLKLHIASFCVRLFVQKLMLMLRAPICLEVKLMLRAPICSEVNLLFSKKVVKLNIRSWSVRILSS